MARTFLHCHAKVTVHKKIKSQKKYNIERIYACDGFKIFPKCVSYVCSIIAVLI